jgi:hypothetical protein
MTDLRLQETVDLVKLISRKIDLDNNLTKLWQGDYEYFWTGLIMSDKFNYKTPILEDDDSVNDLSFWEFFNLTKDPLSESDIDALAFRCSSDVWNYFLRLILNGKLKETLPMQEIASKIYDLTKTT